MAAPRGTDDPGLEAKTMERELRSRPFRFEFFQAVRLIERLLPGRKPIGRFEKPSEEAVRLGSHSTLSFPASEIQSLDWPEKPDRPPQMTVNFMGLTGPEGVLPLYYTELVASRLRAGDKALRDFLDLFNHRIISFFYRAWEKYRFAVSYERDERDRFTQYLKDLIGLGTTGLAERQPLPDRSLLYYAGLLAQRPRSAAALKQLLSDYFDVPVEIEQFAGAWYRLDSSTQCNLEEESSYSQQLGRGAVVGDEVWTQESRVRIKLGPLSLSQYLDFLPTGTAYEPVRALTRFFSNDELDFEIQLILRREDVPPCELGAGESTAPRLGWLSWVKSAPSQSHAGDTVLAL